MNNDYIQVLNDNERLFYNKISKIENDELYKYNFNYLFFPIKFETYKKEIEEKYRKELLRNKFKKLL